MRANKSTVTIIFLAVWQSAQDITYDYYGAYRYVSWCIGVAGGQNYIDFDRSKEAHVLYILQYLATCDI